MTDHIVILTGAGISAESGIQTFRAADGLWYNHRVEDVASPEGFAKDPELVHAFYNQRRRQLLSDSVSDNAAHRALARLQTEHTGTVTLVTQNVDDLHERAGSTSVIHMHGELLKKRCSQCGGVTAATTDITTATVCDNCGLKSRLRPHIVWFGEMPFEMQRIETALARCSLFVSIGTSGNVYPAAGFVQIAAQSGADTLELNLEPSATANLFRESRHGPATTQVTEWVNEILSR